MGTLNSISNVEVRRHNGQSAYGPWMPVGDQNVPSWVADLIAGEIAENGAEDGRVEQGGSIWAWRKA